MHFIRFRTPTSSRTAVVLVALAGALTLGVAVGHAAPPANDDVASAEPIEGESGSRTASNVEATLEPNEPNHDGDRSLWYRWTAPVTSPYVFETCNAPGVPRTTFDTVLAIYRGPPTAFRRIVRNDDACAEQSHVTLDAVAGETYHVAVAGFDEDARGRFTLRWRRVVPAANDAFTAAQQLQGATGTVRGTTIGATLEPGEPRHGPRSTASVWFSWTSPVTAPLAFEMCGSTFDTLLAIYTGEALTALRQLVRNDDSCGTSSKVPLSARAGTTYRIAVAGYGRRGDFVLRWLRRPPNDDFANARRLRGAAGSASGSTTGATAEANDPRGRVASVWFEWRARTAAAVAFSTCTSSFDTVLAVYRRTSSGRRVVLASNDDGCRRGLGSLIVLRPQSGSTYVVALDGLAGATGTYRLVWGRPPANAWCLVPDIRGRTLNAARRALERANCALGRVERVASTIAPRGVVVAQFPPPSDTRRPFGTRVNVEVSRGRS